MSEAVERVKAGDERAGQVCGWCTIALGAEDDAAICAECASAHHDACWDRELGCSMSGCLNAPLKRLDAPAPGAEGKAAVGAGKDAARRRPRKQRLQANLKACVDCGALMHIDEEICDTCHAINTPDGLYHGPKTNAPGATQALVLGLAGIVICGPILGLWAISKAQSAKAAIRLNPRYGGEGLATADFILGIVDLVLWGITLLVRLAR